jgi:hypothetical protein
MKIVEVGEKKYEVQSCLHCKRDEIEYNPADEPWHDEQWICSFCCSTYVIFNDEIAKKVE